VGPKFIDSKNKDHSEKFIQIEVTTHENHSCNCSQHSQWLYFDRFRSNGVRSHLLWLFRSL